MDDLKQKILEIDSISRNNRGKYNGKSKYYAIVKLALERGELTKLLSADETYIYGNDNRLWLSAPYDLTLSDNPIHIISLLSELEMLYLKARRSDRIDKTNTAGNIKNAFAESFKEMCSGAPEQLYFAVQIFTWLTEGIKTGINAFEDVRQKKQLDDELRSFLIAGIANHNVELKNIHIYDCKERPDGLWGYCLYCSKKLETQGLKGFEME